MEYKINLEMFEGPMDLLLHLIDKNEIDIYDIPIYEITEQYMEYIGHMKKLDLDVTSEFIVMAATLLEIKSKLLLPKIKQEIEDEELEDPREELVRKLVEYKRFKIAADELKEIENLQQLVYYKPREDIEIEQDSKQLILENVKLYDIYYAFEKIVKKYEAKNDKIVEPVKTISKDEITIDEAMIKIKKVVFEHNVVTFENLFEGYKSKSALIVIFLALLELIKLSTITIEQESNFGEIIIKSI